jgi:hypothetical protein
MFETRGGPLRRRKEVVLFLRLLQNNIVLHHNITPFFDSRWSDLMDLYFMPH